MTIEGGMGWLCGYWLVMVVVLTRGLTPCACVWVINSRVDVAEVYFAHEAIDLLWKLVNFFFFISVMDFGVERRMRSTYV